MLYKDVLPAAGALMQTWAFIVTSDELLTQALERELDRLTLRSLSLHLQSSVQTMPHMIICQYSGL